MNDPAHTARTVAFVPSVDVDRAARFYGEVLGLRPISVDPYAAVFMSGATIVRVTAVPSLHPQPFTVLGWEVDDLMPVVRALVARGVELVRYEGMAQDDRGVWTAPGGALVCWFRDPDGNTLSITQTRPSV